DDLEVLKDRAEEVEKVLRSIEGAKDVSTEAVSGLPVLNVKLRQDQLARYGISARVVLDQVEALGGKPVGEGRGGGRRVPLAARLRRGVRRDREGFADLPVTAPGGERIPLSRLAEVELAEGPAKVSREWGQRRVTVQCSVEGRDVGSFVAEARRAVA